MRVNIKRKRRRNSLDRKDEFSRSFHLSRNYPKEKRDGEYIYFLSQTCVEGRGIKAAGLSVMALCRKLGLEFEASNDNET